MLLKKGIAWPNATYWEELGKLGAQFHYAEGGEPHPCFIPMTKNALASELSNFPSDYSGYMLVFNEPNNSYQGSKFTPHDAAHAYGDLVEDFPDARMIIGNVAGYADWLQGTEHGSGDAYYDLGYHWMHDFYHQIINHEYPLPYRWGYHAYIIPNQSEATLAKNKTYAYYSFTYTGNSIKYWITEFGDQNQPPTASNYESWIHWCKDTTWIDGLFFYTNRQTCEYPCQHTPPHDWVIPGCDLFDWDTGDILAAGEVVRDEWAGKTYS